MKHIRLVFLSLVLLFSGGCFVNKKPAAAVPVTVLPPVSSSPPATPPPTDTAQQPVPIPVPAPAQQPPAPTTETGKPSPFPPAATPTAPVRPKPTPALPAPALGAILTADQRKQLDTAYQADLRQANTLLNGLNGRSLTAEQTNTVNRARAFIRQAAQYHDHDLTTAAELAHRARVLTQDLAGALK